MAFYWNKTRILFSDPGLLFSLSAACYSLKDYLDITVIKIGCKWYVEEINCMDFMYWSKLIFSTKKDGASSPSFLMPYSNSIWTFCIMSLLS